MDEIQRIIESGTKKLEKKKQEQQARDAEEKAARIKRHREFYAEIRKSLVDQIPPAILDYCQIDHEKDEDRGLDYHLMCTVNAPGCSLVRFQINIAYPVFSIGIEEFQVQAVLYDEPVIYDGELFEGWVELDWQNAPTTKDIEIAMAMAAENWRKFKELKLDRVAKIENLRKSLIPSGNDSNQPSSEVLNEASMAAIVDMVFQKIATEFNKVGRISS